MPSTPPAATEALALDAVVARLAAHPAVDGVAILGSGEPLPADSWDGWLVQALRTARIGADRAGRLARAQAAACLARLAPTPAEDKYRTWFSVNYHVSQNRRLLGTGEKAAIRDLAARHPAFLARSTAATALAVWADLVGETPTPEAAHG